MKHYISEHLRTLKSAPKTLWITYCVIYFIWGIGMNEFGKTVEIAKFTFWWQVITCYILYMVPISIILKRYSFFQQYAYGLVAMGILEFLGYWLETSYIYPDNLMDQFFNRANFSLGMALFFALYFPAGNWLVSKVHNSLFKT